MASDRRDALMPDKLSNPRDLFLTLLSEALYVERRLAADILPTLHEQASDEELEEALAEHLEQTRAHVERVGSAFRAVRAEPAARRSPPLEALASEHEELAGSVVLPSLRDGVHAAAAAHGEHYEIAAYGALLPLARALAASEAIDALEQNLRDEEKALRKLEKIVDRLVHEATLP